MPGRYKVATVDEFEGEGSRVIAEIEGQEIAVFRVDGEFHALANYCVHQGGPLCEGKVRGRMTAGDDGWSWEFDETKRTVECPWHGWLFDVTTGRNTANPNHAAPTYDVEVEDGDVFVVR